MPEYAVVFGTLISKVIPGMISFILAEVSVSVTVKEEQEEISEENEVDPLRITDYEGKYLGYVNESILIRSEKLEISEKISMTEV